MVKGSTSSHLINGDHSLSLPGKLFYFFLNWQNNLFPFQGVEEDFFVGPFVCSDLKTSWPFLERGVSPARKWADLFIQRFPWERVRDELGPVHVVDVGCGSGDYGLKLCEWSGNTIDSYHGFDLSFREKWNKISDQEPRCRFAPLNSSALAGHIPKGTNFFFSHSAIEHFSEDLVFFSHIRDHILSCGQSVVQVHLFPSAACLGLYGCHGIRQYTPRTAAKIARLFAPFSNAALFGLGGRESVRIHQKYIRRSLWGRGRDERSSRESEYDRDLFQAMQKDMAAPSWRDPHYYALVIHSYPKRFVFDGISGSSTAGENSFGGGF
ncbi:MAG: class I SAM-dependent methyltransferase [Elusimicrobia bacterium]|nr:class I SAM-dependent methyltransferase [Elusimicrobiota bacterium]